MRRLKEEKLSRIVEETQDIVEKEFLGFSDIAEDVFNVLLYDGKKVAKKEKLLAGPTESMYQAGEKLKNQFEDLCMYEMVNGKVRMMYLVANQSRTDGKMLLRKAALIKMIKVLSGDTDIGEVEKWMREQGVREDGEVKVCELFDQYERRGRKEGEKLGIAKGETRFVSLTSILLSSQRLDDLNKAVSDEKFRNSLYQEFTL